MKKLFLGLLFIATTGVLRAYDFKMGDLYYNILADYSKAVEVTYELYNNQSNYSGLINADIPNSVTYLGTIYSVLSIGEEAFYGCSSLTSVTIPNSITTIGRNAFEGCCGLSSVTIPNSVTSIREFAFSSCSRLSSVIISNSVTSMGEYVFKNCSSLASITIPNSVTSIGGGVFYGCNSLNSVTIPNSVTSIGGTAFYQCSSMTSVTIPNSVTSIGWSAFWGCSGLSSFTSEAVTPPTLGSDVFREVDTSIPLYVPAESITRYQSAAQWKNFNVQAIREEDALPEIMTDENAQDGKFMIDGVLYIRKDGRVFDINGIELR